MTNAAPCRATHPNTICDKAAHLRALAATTPIIQLKARLLEEAEQHECLAGEKLEALNTPAV